MADQVGEDPRWLTDDQLASWRSVMAMLMTLPAALDAQLRRDAGINTFEYHILVGLADRPDSSMAMGELAVYTQGSPSRLSHAAGRLERAGWIERRSGEARCVNAHLTEAGRQKLVETAPGHVREVRRLVIDSLTPEQLSVLGECARTVAEHADPRWVPALAREIGGGETCTGGNETCDSGEACDSDGDEPCNRAGGGPWNGGEDEVGREAVAGRAG